MPELPEVETTVRALRPLLKGRVVERMVVRHRRLRWPVPADLEALLEGRRVLDVSRRAKYLLIRVDGGTLIVHLGMSGSFCVAFPGQGVNKHDHVDIMTDHGVILRYHDPRRFGAFLWTSEDPATHKLMAGLGPEPLGRAFSGGYLHALGRGRKGSVKSFLMDGAVVVGVGNIYANEALFLAGIRPSRPAGRVSLADYETLAACLRQVLRAAIRAGGTTLRDFAAGRGQTGEFQVALSVYGRGGEPCLSCGTRLRETRIVGRTSVWCSLCQR